MTLLMKPIPGFDGRYSATSDGQIYSHITERILKPKVHNNGYCVVSLTDPHGDHHDLLIHRLVCLAYHGYPEIWQTDVNHIDCNKANNRPENLEWCTRAENMQHAKANGRYRAVAEAARKTCISRRKPVEGYDVDGNLICTFESVVAARRAGYAKVSDVLLGNRKTAGGLTWKYA